MAKDIAVVAMSSDCDATVVAEAAALSAELAAVAAAVAVAEAAFEVSADFCAISLMEAISFLS